MPTQQLRRRGSAPIRPPAQRPARRCRTSSSPAAAEGASVTPAGFTTCKDDWIRLDSLRADDNAKDDWIHDLPPLYMANSSTEQSTPLLPGTQRATRCARCGGAGGLGEEVPRGGSGEVPRGGSGEMPGAGAGGAQALELFLA